MALKSFHTSILIAASPERIWENLVDVANWTQWNSTVDKVIGHVALGSKVTVYAKISPGRAFPLKVSEFVPPQRLVLTGGMPLGLFTGKRIYGIKTEFKGQSRFEMTEAFTGLMAPLITRSIPDLQPSFEEFAACLKRVSEQK